MCIRDRAKLIVSGEDRTEALERSRRALSEYVVTGIPTVIPFHQAMVEDPAFVGDGEGFDVYTRWIEEAWVNTLPAAEEDAADDADGDEDGKRTFSVEVNGRRVEVALPHALLFGGAQRPRQRRRRQAQSTAAASGDTVAAPMQGTVVKVNVAEGDEVAEGDVLLVLEAMKMENPVKAHKAGTVTGLTAEAGAQVNKGAALLELK